MFKNPILRIRWIVAALLILFLADTIVAQTSKIRIETEPGVPEEAITSAKTAVDSASRFFKETFNLEYNKDLRILIVPTPESYAAAFVRESKVNQKEAERRARTTFGWSIGENLILQNVGAPFNPNLRRRVYNIGHEITHKYQAQECLDRCSKIMWLYEGIAGAFAAKIVEISGDRPLAQQKESWLQEVRKMGKRPGLSEIVSQADWYKGLDKFGTDPLYSFAGLATLKLIDIKGYEPIFAYFRKLKDEGPEDAFNKAFGIDTKRYESEFSAEIKKLLSPKSN